MTQTGQTIYHDTTMVKAQLRNERNRGRARLACHREQAPVTSSSMILNALQRNIDTGRIAFETRHRGTVVPRWLA